MTLQSIPTDDTGRGNADPSSHSHISTQISDRRVSTAISTFVRPNEGLSFRITAFIYRLQTDGYEDI